MPKYEGAYLTGAFAGKKVYVGCERCKIQRRYDGNAIIERAGTEVALPDLLTTIAAGLGCYLNLAPTPNGIRCGLRYEGPSVLGRQKKP